MNQVSRSLCVVALLAMAPAIHGVNKPDPPGVEATLEIESLTPPPLSSVVASTVVAARLKYSIIDFRPREFFVDIQFDTREEGMTQSPRGSPLANSWPLRKPSGELTVKQPLRAVWGDSHIARPFRIWFYLHQRLPGGRSTVVAEVGPIEYREQ